ncbi:hypothetical protein [Synechococcus sp. ROS8604]|uniref:hypothetical protein n=1 Tax=Synechococcus sp. ROS8604 TaxID=1442557 RepID=UPI001648674C|nr:hypothetical protein [Synechococcus sp. ROS8604]
MECRSTWRSRDCLPKDGTRRWVKKLLEQGPSGQAASVICSGGVSAVMAPPISIHKVWLRRVDSASVQSRIATRTKTDEERPPLPDGRDGLARSFMHIANQYPVNLYRRSVNLETTTVNGKRSAKRLAFGAWGLVPKW